MTVFSAYLYGVNSMPKAHWLYPWHGAGFWGMCRGY